MVKNLPANAGDAGNMGSSPGSGRFPREENDFPLQYSCLENSMERTTWRATVHGLAKKLDTPEQLTHTVYTVSQKYESYIDNFKLCSVFLKKQQDKLILIIYLI